MMNREHKKQKMQALTDHYGLSRPVTEEMQDRMADGLGPMYSSIIKKSSRYTVTAAIIAGLYFLVKKTGIPLAVVKVAAAITIGIPIVTGLYLASSPAEKPAALPAITVTVKPFTSTSMEPAVTARVTGEIIETLNSMNGASYSILAQDNKLGDTPWAILGSIEKPGKSIHIFVKIIDTSTSRMIYITEEKLSSPRDLDDAVRRMCARLPLLKGR